MQTDRAKFSRVEELNKEQQMTFSQNDFLWRREREREREIAPTKKELEATFILCIYIVCMVTSDGAYIHSFTKAKPN